MQILRVWRRDGWQILLPSFRWNLLSLSTGWVVRVEAEDGGNKVLWDAGACLPVDSSFLRTIYSHCSGNCKPSCIIALRGTLLTRQDKITNKMHMSVCIRTRSFHFFVHSVQQKSIGLKFSKSRTESDVRYSCHHNSCRFTFPIFAHSCRFSVLHSLQSITPRIH
jgi:hypothetical protein